MDKLGYYINCSIPGGIRQTAKAPARPCVFGGFPFFIDGGVDGFDTRIGNHSYNAYSSVTEQCIPYRRTIVRPYGKWNNSEYCTP